MAEQITMGLEAVQRQNADILRKCEAMDRLDNVYTWVQGMHSVILGARDCCPSFPWFPPPWLAWCSLPPQPPMDAMLRPVVEPTPLKEDGIASVIADLESKLDGKLRCITDIINVMASRAEIIDKTDSCSGCDRNDNLCWYSEPDRETSPIKPMGNTIKRGSASNVESRDDTFGQSGNGVEHFDMACDDRPLSRVRCSRCREGRE
jgi:hypothetical protein